jgi:hypothetical protein
VKILPVAVTILLLSLQIGATDSSTGSVCVASRADDPWWKVPVPQALESRGLRLGVDKRQVVPWPKKESLKIEGLDLSERHLLVILDANSKPIESLWFRFSTYKSPNLCMAYDGYQGIGLKEANRHTPWCKCK